MATLFRAILKHDGKSRDKGIKESVSPSLTSRACPACRDLDVKNFKEYAHSTTVKELTAASSTCPGCAVIVKGLLATLKGSLDEVAGIDMAAKPGGPLTLSYSFGGDSTNLEFYTPQGAENNWPAFGPARSLSVSHSVDTAAQLVSEWYNECLDGHSLCSEPQLLLPTRVLFVGSEDRDPYLHVTTNSEKARYVALSHCWGDEEHKPLTTTSSNFAAHTRGIPMSTLPPSFVDAILLTRKLGIDYIWIDSLCIIQGDINDWSHEAGHMTDVYIGATLVISADGAANSHEGLFHPVSKRRFPSECQVQPTPATEPGTSIRQPTAPAPESQTAASTYARLTTLEPRADFVHLAIRFQTDPLRTRAWTLQEWLLPVRIVHFCKGEMLWECKTHHRCECQVVSQPVNGGCGEGQKRKTVGRNFFNDGGIAVERHSPLFWTKVVSEYTRRHITKDTDRLSAVSGLAGHRPNGAADYLGGVWRSELPGSFLWSVRPLDPERGCRRVGGDDFYAPSWSWASVTGHVEMHAAKLPDKEIPKCQILEYNQVCATANPFGALKSAFAKVTGPVTSFPPCGDDFGRARTYSAVHTCETPALSYSTELYLDVTEPRFEVEKSSELVILILYFSHSVPGSNPKETKSTIYGLALKKTQLGTSDMRRVGLVKLECEGKVWRPWIKEVVKPSVQTLILV